MAVKRETDDLRFGDKGDAKECLEAEKTEGWKVGRSAALDDFS